MSMPQQATPDKNIETHALYKNRVWRMTHGVRVQAHDYDGTLYAFEVTQRTKCLGTLIPTDIEDMRRMESILDKNQSINGFPCNDQFGTIIHVTN